MGDAQLVGWRPSSGSWRGHDLRQARQRSDSGSIFAQVERGPLDPAPSKAEQEANERALRQARVGYLAFGTALILIGIKSLLAL
jgi:hypothetical protein